LTNESLVIIKHKFRVHKAIEVMSIGHFNENGTSNRQKHYFQGDGNDAFEPEVE
jgi:hypothetical protein